MTVLVVGGAGYIGSHIVRLLTAAGREVLVVDDESTGFRHRNPDVPHVRIDVTSDEAAARLTEIMRDAAVTEIVHLAALKQVAQSVADPPLYYRSNIAGLANVIHGMRGAGVTDIVLSSTAAVYGDVHGAPVTEDLSPRPVNPYGWSKWAGEQMLGHSAASFGLRGVSLRYFNVAGAGWPDLGDRGATNLVPLLLGSVREGRPPLVFGGDYPTPDGSAVRDYVHVRDVAEAHLVALDYLGGQQPGHEVFNVGTGEGTSVLQVVAETSRVAGTPVEPRVVDRRPGDPASVVADVTRIAERTGWRARFSLADIVVSAWEADTDG